MLSSIPVGATKESWHLRALFVQAAVFDLLFAKSGLHLQPALCGVRHFAEPLRRDRVSRMTNRKYRRLFSYLEAQRARV